MGQFQFFYLFSPELFSMADPLTITILSPELPFKHDASHLKFNVDNKLLSVGINRDGRLLRELCPFLFNLHDV